MNIHLVVVQAFGPYAKGDHVADPATVAGILASPNAQKVVRIQAPIAPNSQEA
jgi:hypothetical protein